MSEVKDKLVSLEDLKAAMDTVEPSAPSTSSSSPRNLEEVFESDTSGKSNVWEWLQDKVVNDMSSLNIGDYVDVDTTIHGTIRYQIGSFNPYYNVTRPHIAMVPEHVVVPSSSSTYYIASGQGASGAIQWNSTETNNGKQSEQCPYLCSRLHEWEVGEFFQSLPAELQNVIVERTYENIETRYQASTQLTNSSGYMPNKSLGKVWSLAEVEVIGFISNGTADFSLRGASAQYPIFYEAKNRVKYDKKNNIKSAWWTRTPAKDTAAYVVAMSSSDPYTTPAFPSKNATTALPCFLIG